MEDFLGGNDPRESHPYLARQEQERRLQEEMSAWETGQGEEYLRIAGRAAEVEQKIQNIQAARLDNIQAIAQTLKEINSLGEDELKREAKRLGFTKKNKEMEEAIAAVKAEGGKYATDEQKERVAALELELAKRKDIARLAEEGSTKAAELLKEARRSTKPGLLDIRGQGRELRESLRDVNLTDPGSLFAVIRRNPTLAAALTVGTQLPGMESRGIGIPGFIPGLGGMRIPGSDFGAAIREGQVTGEGYRAGLGARWQAFTMGMNPFDTISREVANSIVQGVRARGFRGELGRAFQASVRGVYEDLGIDPNLAIQLGEPFARQGRFGDFERLMNNMDDVARDTSRSVETVTQIYQQLSTQLRQTGGMTTGPYAAGITAALGRMFPGLTDEQLQQQAGQIPQLLTRLTGLPATTTGTRAGMRQALPIMGRTLDQLRQGAPGGRVTDQYVAILTSPGGPLEGLDFMTARRMLMQGSRFTQQIQRETFEEAREQEVGRPYDAIEEATREAGRAVGGRGGPIGWLRRHTRVPGFGLGRGSLRDDIRRARSRAREQEFERQLARADISEAERRNIRAIAEQQGIMHDETRGAFEDALRRGAGQEYAPVPVDVVIGFRGDAGKLLEAYWRERGRTRGDNNSDRTHRAP